MSIMVFVRRLASAHTPKVTVMAKIGHTVAPNATNNLAASITPLYIALPTTVATTNISIATNPEMIAHRNLKQAFVLVH